MSNIDRQYHRLIRETLSRGTYKDTRSGVVISIFDETLKIDMNEGFPLLTTKKMFFKGIAYELLWFLKGDTNIRFLVDNNVHIWDDDAYRHYKSIVEKSNEIAEENPYFYDDKYIIKPVDKETFIRKVSEQETLRLCDSFGFVGTYKYGDLGPVYGAQWRGPSGHDQLSDVMEMLMENPDDRRMIVDSWNTNEMDEMALPPCHYSFQVYTRRLTVHERLEWLCRNDGTGKFDEWKTTTHDVMDRYGVPVHELSLKWIQRSVDEFLGLPFNIASYGLLLHIMANICNMTVGTLGCSLGDCHIYESHLDAVNELLGNDTEKYSLCKLVFNRKLESINDIYFDDFKIVDYESFPQIKAPLSVG